MLTAQPKNYAQKGACHLEMESAPKYLVIVIISAAQPIPPVSKLVLPPLSSSCLDSRFVPKSHIHHLSTIPFTTHPLKPHPTLSTLLQYSPNPQPSDSPSKPALPHPSVPPSQHPNPIASTPRYRPPCTMHLQLRDGSIAQALALSPPDFRKWVGEIVRLDTGAVRADVM